MNNLCLIFSFLILAACQTKNIEFNPFDDEFEFHRNFISEEYDTIFGECGYWNLTKKTQDLKPYYQFYLNEKPIVAKGFDLILDEIEILEEDSLKNDSSTTQKFVNQPINLALIVEKLKIFNIKEVKVLELNSVISSIKLTDNKDAVYNASIMINIDSNKITRKLSYFNAKKNSD